MTGFVTAISSVSDAVDRVLRVVAIFFLAVMVGLICLQVLARYGFSSPPAWTEEAARYAMVWVGLLGASVSFKARFDPALVSYGPETGRPKRLIAGAIQAASVVIFFSPILWYCFFGPKMNVARSFLMRTLNVKAETFDMSMIFVSVTVPVFILAIGLHGLSMIVKSLSQPE
ncbi:TRAP-type C4-dicarboxylate transport system, small permease component [Thalassovita litoralis]|jgi:TRAP-type C4-dicarboxylate transport system permease small subunit|uniref:TRAP transporter small permease protein n=1 Tax=Thalassovita litoralis TaxID=1010611 RepID=A0A521BNH1_9RHOB|nr:TRAP transporter small permease subunit [Thalassovita litoralis]SMO48665.1 TRAP-type C4-dicarboxylate transport system, small permease component [Thalassovita litoralis]